MAETDDTSAGAKPLPPSRDGELTASVSATPLMARGPPEAMPIVVIGASAGGLEATSKLLDSLPDATGMAFIIIQHLDPTHKSMMVALLTKHSAMKILEALDGSQLSPNHIYVIPPGRYLSVRAGTLHLSPKQTQQGARLPFDHLLQSLAKEYGPRTTAIVLSGTGADGSGAIGALKAAGGYIIAQLPEEAEYDGMSRSAIATGLVDEVLPLADIPAALFKQLIRPVKKSNRTSVEQEQLASGLEAIIALLKEKTSHDFTQYKPGTMERRIERRMGLLAMERRNLSAYLELLNSDPDERELLAKDLLINVTSFFRDPGVYDALLNSAIPELIERLAEHQPLRVWVAGCSTGEEAYSIAITCRETIKASGRDIKLQVFASDVDADAIAKAREGLYPLEIAGAISAERLARNFIKDDAGYRISTSLRGDVVFTVQDLLTDPPFSKIDLISCRNLLIYLNTEAQAQVISLFHFALRENGLLVLGSSETIGGGEDRFEPIAKYERIYRHIARSRSAEPRSPLRFGETLPAIGLGDRIAPLSRQTTLADICRTAVLATHAPAAILINHNRQCVYSMGPVERYLRIPPGYTTLDVLAMATPALRTRLRLAIDEVGPNKPRVDGGKTRMTYNGKTVWFRTDVQALKGDHEELMLVCFTEEHAEPRAKAFAASRNNAPRVAELELELEATRAELQAAILHQEMSSQEQKAINEEALSVNEEFQSTNEELLTSKEELQSLNEELTALNSQLQETLERQRLTSDDLQNVLYSTNVGTLFLDMELKIRFYTPAIRSLFSIIAGDIGRPLADLQPIATDHNLLADARQVLIDKVLIEREIDAPDETFFLRRIFPYRTDNARVEGVVITFADITERKIAAKALETAKLEAERANVAKSRFLSAASHDLRQPLQSMTLLQDLLARTVQGEKPKRLVARLEQTVGAMSGMLNALLDINQIEAGITEARPIRFPVAGVLDSLRDEFTSLAQSRGLTLRILSSDAFITSDPALLSQMIRNLLGNAVKYTRQGKILLGCRCRGNTLRIEVWDTGIGIAADQLHAIFDEFHQVDNAARERSLGLGLGLSIVQRLGQLLGHDVDVRSKPGKGSVFTVTIADAISPIAIVEPTTVKIDTDEVINHHSCRIVVVDDDPDVLELLEQLLTDEGHSVKCATSAAEALKIITGGAMLPEILLTDYSLPGGTSGLELMHQLRSRLAAPLPAIILSGDVSSETLAKVAAQGCMQLSKPVKPRELLSAIERLCVGSCPIAPIAAQTTDKSVGAVAYVIDEDPDVRATIREVLESDGQMVKTFSSAEAFLAAYAPGGEGCLLVDVNLSGMTGIALLQKLRAQGDNLPVIMIAGSAGTKDAVQALRNGACDFIEKPVGRAELIGSIARAVDQSHEIRIVEATRDAAAALVAQLTNRQRQVMEMVLRGQPSKNIAADLGISQRTVENHRAAIMAKMAAKSLPELARIAQAAAVERKA